MNRGSENSAAIYRLLPLLIMLLLVTGLTEVGRELLALPESSEAVEGLLRWLTLAANAGVVVVCAASLLLWVRAKD